MSKACPFCSPSADRLIYVGDYAYGMWDAYPVTQGHALLIPRRHVPSWFDATPEEQQELMQALSGLRARILAQYPAVGFNIGINDGSAAGQTVDHLHVHLIPRYAGDHPDPTGGVRHVIPDKANYLQRPHQELPMVRDAVPGHSRLVTGATDPLLPRMHSFIRQAKRADIAVAFLRQSGLNLLSEHLLELLERGGELRLVTGDYLGITEPKALYQIYDWMQHPEYGQRIQARLFRAKEYSFHPKAYLFRLDPGTDKPVAIVGSTNLSKMALTNGIEWNYQVYAAQDPVGYQEVVDAFSALWVHPATVALDDEVIEHYAQHYTSATVPVAEIEPEEIVPPPEPHLIQREALQALEDTRYHRHCLPCDISHRYHRHPA